MVTKEEEGEHCAQVEWNTEDVAEIFSEWMGRSISKAEAEKIITKIRRRAGDEIARAGFSVIAGFVEEYP